MFRKVNRTGDHHITRNKPDSQRQVVRVIANPWNLGEGKKYTQLKDYE